MEDMVCIKRYHHLLGGNTIAVKGSGELLEKLDRALVSGYLERDENGRPKALYIHITRKEDVKDFSDIFIGVWGSFPS